MQCNMMSVVFYPSLPVAESQLEFSVVAARYCGQWVLCRHKDRNSWEIPGGHIEQGESALEAAKRELLEETGAEDADIRQVGYYSVQNEQRIQYGALFFADVNKMGILTIDSEITEVLLATALPENLTYPQIQPRLFLAVQEWLNMQSACDELWDVYDKDRKLTGRTHKRGEYLNPGDFHLVVYIWMQNSSGQFLLTKRSPNKGFPNMWETTGGSAVAGDDSLTAALREVREETGLVLDPDKGTNIINYAGEDYFADVWLFSQDFDLRNVVLLEGETCDAGYFSLNDIIDMQKVGEMVPYRHLSKLIEYLSEK